MSKYDNVLKPFVILMERELAANSSKGDRPAWLKMSRQDVLLELHQHVGKLQQVVINDDEGGILEHAADVANIAMMTVDTCGAWGAFGHDSFSHIGHDGLPVLKVDPSPIHPPLERFHIHAPHPLTVGHKFHHQNVLGAIDPNDSTTIVYSVSVLGPLYIEIPVSSLRPGWLSVEDMVDSAVTTLAVGLPTGTAAMIVPSQQAIDEGFAGEYAKRVRDWNANRLGFRKFESDPAKAAEVKGGKAFDPMDLTYDGLKKLYDKQSEELAAAHHEIGSLRQMLKEAHWLAAALRSELQTSQEDCASWKETANKLRDRRDKLAVQMNEAKTLMIEAQGAATSANRKLERMDSQFTTNNAVNESLLKQIKELKAELAAVGGPDDGSKEIIKRLDEQLQDYKLKLHLVRNLDDVHFDGKIITSATRMFDLIKQQAKTVTENVKKDGPGIE